MHQILVLLYSVRAKTSTLLINVQASTNTCVSYMTVGMIHDVTEIALMST